MGLDELYRSSSSLLRLHIRLIAIVDWWVSRHLLIPSNDDLGPSLPAADDAHDDRYDDAGNADDNDEPDVPDEGA